MKQLWTAVILLATVIFSWQAVRIYQGLNSEEPAVVITESPADTAEAEKNEPSLDPTPQEHTVEKGETLHTIGLKYNLRWSSIADLNGLTESTPIVEGDVLLLPITKSGHIIEVRVVTVDLTTAQNAQNDARFSGVTWRLDPVEVVRSSAPTELGIKHDTALEIESRDDTTGTAIIKASIDGSLRRVFLSQPVVKGSSGVWFVTKTESYRWPN